MTPEMERYSVLCPLTRGPKAYAELQVLASSIGTTLESFKSTVSQLSHEGLIDVVQNPEGKYGVLGNMMVSLRQPAPR